MALVTIGTAVASTPREATPAAPSGAAMPVGDPPGWRQVLREDFQVPAATGAFPGREYGNRWRVYPDGWPDTTHHGTYRPSAVLSVHDGLLDYHVRTEHGVHLVAAALPRMSPGRYGRFSVRFRADPLHGYKTAWLLWPDSGRWPADGEIDFPEGNLDSTIHAYLHHASPRGGQEAFATAARFTSWHTATTEWRPGSVTFVLDGRPVGTARTKVPSRPMHWVLQTETSTDDGAPADRAAGHVLIDWVVAYRRT